MTIEEYRSKRSGHTITGNKYTTDLVKRTLITALIVTILLVVTTISDTAKGYVKKYLLETNFEFSKINAFYQNFLNLDKDNDDVAVNGSDLVFYSGSEKYLDGVKLNVNDNNVSLLESGIVVFVGEKEGYGNTIIVQQSNGIDAWYGGIENVGVTIYDYIEKGSIIGNVNEVLYMAFQKNGEFLDYTNYIK